LYLVLEASAYATIFLKFLVITTQQQQRSMIVCASKLHIDSHSRLYFPNGELSS